MLVYSLDMPPHPQNGVGDAAVNRDGADAKGAGLVHDGRSLDF